MKKRLTSLILAFALLLAIIPMAYAALPDGGATSVYMHTNCPKEPFSLVAEPGQLVFCDLSGAEDFTYLWFYLLDGKGAKHGECVLARSAGNKTAFSLKGIADGTYTVQIYTNSERYGTFYSYIWGGELPIRITGGTAVFPLSPVYPHNKTVYSEKRTDQTALDYYKKPEKGIQSEDAEIIALAKKITAGLSGDYDKALAIHDWVCDNIYYDKDILYGRAPFGDQSATGTLKRKRAVCEGYARLAAALLRASGIPAKLVTGYALGITGSTVWTEKLVNGDGENHAWTEAFVDGRWIIIDTTWDSGNSYEHGKNTEHDGLTGYRYFDATLEAFSNDHKITEYSERSIPAPPADAPSDYAVQHINRAVGLGIVPQSMQSGYQKAVTRAEFCALAVVLIENVTGAEITVRKEFTDTSDINVQKIGGLGIVAGVGGGTFSPGDKLKRQEAAIILAKLAKVLGKPLPEVVATFDDMNAVPSWAVTAVGQVRGAGIMSGMGGNRFDPAGDYTREQSMITLLKMYDWYLK